MEGSKQINAENLQKGQLIENSFGLPVMQTALLEYYVSACCAIFEILLSQVRPVFAEQNVSLQSFAN